MKCAPRGGYFELPEEELLQLEITKGSKKIEQFPIYNVYVTNGWIT